MKIFRASLAPFVHFGCRSICSSANLHKVQKVPEKSVWPTEDQDLTTETKVNDATVELLERLSLVAFSNQAAVERLASAIRFADQLQHVNTEGVEPMDSVLENRNLYLRQDVVAEGNCREEVMKNAAKRIEEYFVAPPGNIPLKIKEKPYSGDVFKKTSEGT